MNASTIVSNVDNNNVETMRYFVLERVIKNSYTIYEHIETSVN